MRRGVGVGIFLGGFEDYFRRVLWVFVIIVRYLTSHNWDYNLNNRNSAIQTRESFLKIDSWSVIRPALGSNQPIADQWQSYSKSRPKLGSGDPGPNWAVETKVQVGQWIPSLLFLIVLGTQMLVGLIFLFHLLESRILRLPRGRNGSPNGRRSPGGTTPDGSWGSPGSSPGG